MINEQKYNQVIRLIQREENILVPIVYDDKFTLGTDTYKLINKFSEDGVYLNKYLYLFSKPRSFETIDVLGLL